MEGRPNATLLLTNDIRVIPDNWPLFTASSAWLIKGNVTVLGNSSSVPGAFPVLDLGWSARRLMLAPGVIFSMKHVVLENFRSKFGNDFDLFTYSPGALLLFDDAVTVFPYCIEAAIAVPGIRRVPRATGAPPAVAVNASAGENQAVLTWPSGEYCFKRVSGATECTPDGVRFYDAYVPVEVGTSDLQGSGGYSAWYRNTSRGCTHIAPRECIAQFGAAACYNNKVFEMQREALGMSTGSGPASHASGGGHAQLQVILPVTIVGSLALMAVVGLLVWGWYARHSEELAAQRRRKRPPAAGAETTLVVTDIEGSTQAWELLPADQMDAALGLHHACVRRLMRKHYGAESGTEGDSFLLAFHDAPAAVSFSLELQTELLTQPWPAALLGLPPHRPIWLAKPAAPAPPLELDGDTAASGQGSAPAATADASLQQRQQSAEPRGTDHQRQQQQHGSSRLGAPTHSGPSGFLAIMLQGLDEGGVSVPSAAAPEVSSSRDWEAPDGAVAAARSPLHMVSSLVRSYSLGHSHHAGVDPHGASGGPAAGGNARPLSGALGLPAAPNMHWPLPLTGRMENRRRRRMSVSGQAPFQVQAGAGSGGATASCGRTYLEQLRGEWRPAQPLDLGTVCEEDAAAPPAAAAAAAGPGGMSVHSLHSSHSGSRQPPASMARRLAAALGGKARWGAAAGASSGGSSGGLGGWPGAQDFGGAALVIFRGLRVRVGLHCGLAPQDISPNAATGAMQYGGRSMARAKAVCDAAQGGMVLMAASTFRQLAWADIEALPGGAMMLHMGDFHPPLDGAPVWGGGSVTAGGHASGTCEDGGGGGGVGEPLALYQALQPCLMGRLACLGPVRGFTMASLGTLEAPVGHVAVLFMYVVGYATLAAWNQQVTAAATSVYAATVKRLLIGHGGYLVELSGGLCLAAFPGAYDALTFALTVKDKLLAADWPEQLLEHELCEEVAVTSYVPAGPHAHAHAHAHPPNPQQHPGGAPAQPAAAAAGRRSNGAASDAAVGGFGGPPPPGDDSARLGTQGAGGAGISGDMVPSTVVLMRGMRVRVGVDCSSQVLAQISPATGRMFYRGRVMNRAARISSKAGTGTVLCSEEAWARAKAAAITPFGMLTAWPAGTFDLKGVGQLNLMTCNWSDESQGRPAEGRRSISQAGAARRRASLELFASMCERGVQADLLDAPPLELLPARQQAAGDTAAS